MFHGLSSASGVPQSGEGIFRKWADQVYAAPPGSIVALPAMPTRGERLRFAFEYLLEGLFDGDLPACELLPSERADGVSHAVRCRGGTAVHVIVIDPAAYVRGDERILLAAVAHELVHVWREEIGPRNRIGTRGAYGTHDAAWAAKMIAIGLLPDGRYSWKGATQGFEVGQLIIEDGLFDLIARGLFASGFAIAWSEPAGNGGASTAGRPRARKSRKDAQ
jgi:hypothetical protein